MDIVDLETVVELVQDGVKTPYKLAKEIPVLTCRREDWIEAIKTRFSQNTLLFFDFSYMKRKLIVEDVKRKSRAFVYNALLWRDYAQ